MKQALEKIRQAAVQELEAIQDLKLLDTVRVKYLGKKGELTAILKQMGSLTAEERPIIGALANEIRCDIEDKIARHTQELREQALQKKLLEEKLDVTMPGKQQPVGKKHPLTKVLEEIEEISLGMGFDIAEGPEVTTITSRRSTFPRTTRPGILRTPSM